ncbi:DUF1507 family protein [Ammoniphilus sp. CFH 90114]|uniref:DUF1507 family protein n=1 Tax=Ammoniphilus sp. CFH 90114 TaxID=2493665 RepID=UPI0013E96E79|nr:DUF1507 family protein [Ammoniphilus sp. CFH 90114]
MENMRDLQDSVIEQLEHDINKIMMLMEKMNGHLNQQDPLYEDLLNTQLFGLSRVVDFLVRLKLLSRIEGKSIMNNLEITISKSHETFKVS